VVFGSIDMVTSTLHYTTLLYSCISILQCRVKLLFSVVSYRRSGHCYIIIIYLLLSWSRLEAAMITTYIIDYVMLCYFVMLCCFILRIKFMYSFRSIV
jgi:hypothetical protein